MRAKQTAKTGRRGVRRPTTTATAAAAQVESGGEVEVSASPPPSRGRRLLFLSVPYLLLALALLLIEAGTRLALPHVSLLEALVDAPQQRMSLSDGQHLTIFEGDPLLLWRLKPNLDHVIWDFTVISTDSRGLRREGEFGAKTQDTLRVVCVGDSVTFGYRVPVVWPEKPKDYDPAWLPYPALLEKALSAANPTRRVEVIPLAVPGYTSRQGLAWLRRDIEELQPDLVIICFGWNDVNLAARPDHETISSDFVPVTFRRLMSRSQALTHAMLWLKSKRGDSSKDTVPAKPPTERVSAADYIGNILEMARLAREHDAPAIVIAPVYRDRMRNPPEATLIKGYRDGLRAAAEREGLPLLEIRELTEDDYPANDTLFGELIHPNHLGQRLMATELLKLIAARRLLAGVNVPQGL